MTDTPKMAEGFCNKCGYCGPCEDINGFLWHEGCDYTAARVPHSKGFLSLEELSVLRADLCWEIRTSSAIPPEAVDILFAMARAYHAQEERVAWLEGLILDQENITCKPGQIDLYLKLKAINKDKDQSND